MVTLRNIGLYLANSLIGYFYSIIIKDGYLVCLLKDKEIVFFFKYLQQNNLLKFRSLLDVFGVDYLGREKRFEINYVLLSIKYELRLIIKINVKDGYFINTVSNIYYSANWLEREVWDLFGVYFLNHVDLRRILTDYGFEGFPMRKDFPLSGYKEVRYDDGEKRVLQESIELLQEYKYYYFMNPWIFVDK